MKIYEGRTQCTVIVFFLFCFVFFFFFFHAISCLLHCATRVLTIVWRIEIALNSYRHSKMLTTCTSLILGSIFVEVCTVNFHQVPDKNTNEPTSGMLEIELGH